MIRAIDIGLRWLKARDYAEIALGGAIMFLAAGPLFFVIQMWAAEAMNERAQRQIDSAIENAQLQVADALSEAHKFQASLICKGIPINEVCPIWEPRIRP